MKVLMDGRELSFSIICWKGQTPPKLASLLSIYPSRIRDNALPQ